jgi:hypothetical protein
MHIDSSNSLSLSCSPVQMRLESTGWIPASIYIEVHTVYTAQEALPAGKPDACTPGRHLRSQYTAPELLRTQVEGNERRRGRQAGETGRSQGAAHDALDVVVRGDSGPHASLPSAPRRDRRR